MPFPSILSTFNRPNPTDRLNSPSHSALHNTVSSAVGQIEAVIGVEGANSVVGTLEYLIKSPASDGGGHVQVANKGGTGQTTYTKGDVLIAQSSSVVTKLAVGSDGQALVADASQSLGIKWGSGNTKPNVTVYAVSSTLAWVKPANLSYISVEIVAGGGGGGGVAGGGASGGGGGAYARKVYPASMLGVTEIVVIGAAGSGGASGAHDGTAGGNSSFSTSANSILCTGGSAGVSSSGGGATDGAAGGVASGGNVNILGGYGGGGMNSDAATTRAFGGAGGGSYFGSGGGVVTTESGAKSGIAGQAPGSGGSGAATQSGNASGGAGQSGIVIIYEY